jgi:hypothetical protein
VTTHNAVAIYIPSSALGLEQPSNAMDARSPELEKVADVTPASMVIVEPLQPPEVHVSTLTEVEPELANIEQVHDNRIGIATLMCTSPEFFVACMIPYRVTM